MNIYKHQYCWSPVSIVQQRNQTQTREHQISFWGRVRTYMKGFMKLPDFHNIYRYTIYLFDVYIVFITIYLTTETLGTYGPTLFYMPLTFFAATIDHVTWNVHLLLFYFLRKSSPRPQTMDTQIYIFETSWPKSLWNLLSRSCVRKRIHLGSKSLGILALEKASCLKMMR